MKPEMRHVAAEFEVRADGERPVIRGHAATFNTPTVIDGLFEERFLPGAFADTLRNDDLVMVWNHNLDNVLGRVGAGTLRAAEDSTGLEVVNDPPKSAVREIESIERGDVKGMSVRMFVQEQTWEKRTGGIPLRTISKARLIEVSPTAFPAYKSTDISVRSSADVLTELNSAAPTEPPAENLTAIRQRFEFDRKRADFSIGDNQ